MKVWILDPSANTPYYDVDLTAALRAAGVDARLLTSRFLHDDHLPRAEQYADYFFFRALERWARLLRRKTGLRRLARLAVYPFDLLRLWREFQHHTPDVLHIQWTLLPVIDAPLFRRMRARVPLVLTVHNPLPHEQALSRWSDMRPIYELATHIIVHAEQNRQMLLERAGIAPSRVSVVPLGPSLESKAVPERMEARRRLNLPPNAPVVLFFGIIKPYKGLDDLIEAMALVRRQLSDAHLLIAGRLENDDSSYQALLAKHGLEASTIARWEFVPTEDVPMYFAAGDVVCLPYRDASQSAVLPTAYRFARPVVVTDVGGLPEAVEEGGNGYIVPAKNPSALADALAKLLTDPARRERFGARSYELSQTRYGWQRAAELTHEIYRQVVSKSSP